MISTNPQSVELLNNKPNEIGTLLTLNDKDLKSILTFDNLLVMEQDSTEHDFEEEEVITPHEDHDSPDHDSEHHPEEQDHEDPISEPGGGGQ
jgi:hypothetical protein